MRNEIVANEGPFGVHGTETGIAEDPSLQAGQHGRDRSGDWMKRILDAPCSPSLDRPAAGDGTPSFAPLDPGDVVDVRGHEAFPASVDDVIARPLRGNEARRLSRELVH